MPSHIETVLTSLGISAEDAIAILAVPEADQATYDVKPIAEKVKANYQTQFKNDPSFFNDIKLENLTPDVRKQIESGQYARATNVAKEKIAKAFGFTDEEIKDLATDDFKSLDFYVPAIAEKYAKTKAGDKQLQQDLIDARKKLEQFGPDYEANIATKYKSEAEQQITQAIFNANLVGDLAGIEGLKISAGDLAPIAASALMAKYGFVKSGDFSIELRQKANPEMKVLKEGSSQELTLKEALQMIAVEKNWVDKKADPQDQGTGGGKLNIKPEGGKLVMAPHLQDKINKKIAAEA